MKTTLLCSRSIYLILGKEHNRNSIVKYRRKQNKNLKNSISRALFNVFNGLLLF